MSGSTGAQVVLDFASDASRGARGVASPHMRVNTNIRDANLIAAGLDPLNTKGPPTLVSSSAAARLPLPTDNATFGYKIGDQWVNPVTGQVWALTSFNGDGTAVWTLMTVSAFPLDVAAAAGVQALGWWGLQRVTANANVVALNKCCDVWRNSDQATQTIGWRSDGTGGFEADWGAIDAFAAPATSCELTKLYDQAFNVGTGALIGNDATATPGFRVLSATVVSGGTGTPGTYTMTVQGGAGVAATISGTVTGTALAGALTVVSAGSYASVPGGPMTGGTGKSVATLTGGTFTVQPTVQITWMQQAPQLTTLIQNSINGRRCFTWRDKYSPGDPTGASGALGGQTEWMDLPAGMTVTLGNAWTSLHAVQFQTGMNNKETLGLLGPFAGDFSLYAAQAGSAGTPTPTPLFFTHTASPNPMIPPLTSPAVWTWQPGGTQTVIAQGNQTETMTFSLGGGAKTGGAIGAGGAGGGRIASYDFLHMGLFNSAVAAAPLANIKASLQLMTGMTPKSSNLVVVVGDSINFGLGSATTNNQAKLLYVQNLMPSRPLICNVAVSGAMYINTPYDFTANFSGMWASLYRPDQPIWVLITLGRNDLLVGPPTPPAEVTVFNRAVAYVTLLQGLGANVKWIVATTLPDISKIVSDPVSNAAYKVTIDAYNALLRTKALLPIASGGLGATAILDWAASAPWNGQPSDFTSLMMDGTHPNDAGLVNLARTAAPLLTGLGI